MKEIIRSPFYQREFSLGYIVAAWIEHFCVHGNGDVFGQDVVLDDEQYMWTVDCYALDPRESSTALGRRLHDSAFISRAKGRSKSGWAGHIALAEALAPTRWNGGIASGGEVFEQHDFRYIYTAGEPMGEPVTNPLIKIFATEEGQADNVYNVVRANFTEGKLGVFLASQEDAGITQVRLPGQGLIKPQTAGSRSKDGGLESFVVFDETHLYDTRELRELYATVRRNLGSKRRETQPWSLETSTMYEPGADSVAEKTHEQARLQKQLNEIGKSHLARTYFNHREGHADVDFGDEDSVRAAIEEAYGSFIEHVDIDRKISEAMDTRNAVGDTRRYILNQATSAANAWMSAWEWASCALTEKDEYGNDVVVYPTIKKSDLICIGFDGSRGRKKGIADSSVIVGIRISDGYTWTIKAWEQPIGKQGEGWTVDTQEVEDEIDRIFREHTVVGFFADPAKWESSVAKWEKQYGTKLKVKATRSNPITWWMTGGRSGLMKKSFDALEEAIRDKVIKHSKDSILTDHILNARRRIKQGAFVVEKEHPDSAKKVDALMSLMLAYTAYLEALSSDIEDDDFFIPIRIR